MVVGVHWIDKLNMKKHILALNHSLLQIKNLNKSEYIRISRKSKPRFWLKIVRQIFELVRSEDDGQMTTQRFTLVVARRPVALPHVLVTGSMGLGISVAQVRPFWDRKNEKQIYRQSNSVISKSSGPAIIVPYNREFVNNRVCYNWVDKELINVLGANT